VSWHMSPLESKLHLVQAIRGNHDTLMRVLLDEATIDGLVDTCYETKLLLTLLDHGANATTTHLMRALHCRNEELATTMIHHGVIPSSECLDTALRKGSTEIVETICATGHVQPTALQVLIACCHDFDKLLALARAMEPAFD